MLKNQLKLFFVLLLIISIPDINSCSSKLGNRNNSRDFSQLDANGGSGSEPRQNTENIEKKNETQNQSFKLNSTNSPVKESTANVEIELHIIDSKHASSEMALLNKNSPNKLSSSFTTGNSSNTTKVSNHP